MNQALLLSEHGIELWREAVAHLRYLSAEYWRSVALFFSWNIALLLAIFLILRFHRLDAGSAVLIMVLSVMGIFCTGIGYNTVRRQRIYYLQMLAKKSLLEEELGFYGTTFAGSETDLAFPWRLTPEVIGEMRKDVDGWVRKSIDAPGTVARYHFWLFNGAFAVFITVAVFCLWRLVR